MTLDDLKKMSVVELKALAFDLSQERDQINQSISLIFNILNEKSQKKPEVIKQEELPKLTGID